MSPAGKPFVSFGPRLAGVVVLKMPPSGPPPIICPTARRR